MLLKDSNAKVSCSSIQLASYILFVEFKLKIVVMFCHCCCWYAAAAAAAISTAVLDRSDYMIILEFCA